MKKILFFIFFSFFVGGGVVSQAYAQDSVPTVKSNIADNIDGFFGQYFARMVNSCRDNSEFHVTTGFNKKPNFFGKIICTDIREVLKKIQGKTSIGTDTQLPGANVTINWTVMVTNPDIPDDSLGNTLVTKKYVDSNFSQVEAGSVIGAPGQIVQVSFGKRFKSAPFVIAVVENFQYEQKQEQHCWQVRKTRFGRWGWYHKTVCDWRTPLVKLDLGARVVSVTKGGATIQISQNVQDSQTANVKWIAISTDSPITSILSTIVNPAKPTVPAFSEEEKERLKKESQQEADEEVENLRAINSELEEIKKNAIPSKAIMPFYAHTCPAGWVVADGQNGTPDLRGEFIRGLDNGRGADNGRTLGSFQDWSIENITGSFDGNSDDDWRGGYKNGAFYTTNIVKEWSNGAEWGHLIGFDASRVVKTSHETRPRNIALLYCMKQ